MTDSAMNDNLVFGSVLFSIHIEREKYHISWSLKSVILLLKDIAQFLGNQIYRLYNF